MIRVNGKQMDWHEGLTVGEILNNLKENLAIIVVKVNGKPILKKEFNTYIIPNNSEVNTIEIIAGG